MPYLIADNFLWNALFARFRDEVMPEGMSVNPAVILGSHSKKVQ